MDNDLKVLQDLDIDSSFITDYKLQKRYKTIGYSKNRYKEHLNDASLFVPVIKEMLKDNGIPDAFLYLVMAESNFTLNAKSRAKAMGLWQFMPATGKRYGLKQNLYVDERMDLVKSTQSAINYLKKLQKQFGKWYLAAIAYNCGEGRVIEALTRATLDMYYENDPKGYRNDLRMKKYRKTIREYQTKRVKFRELYKIYKVTRNMKYKPGINELLIVQPSLTRQYLPSESQDYIRKIISLALLNNSNYFLEHDNSHLLNMGMLSPIASVKVKGGTHIEDIAKVAGMTKKQLLALNLHIKQDIIPPYEKEYVIYIPYSKLTRFNKNIINMQPSKYYVHVVKSGESLASIGKKYKIPYKIIK
ncbi:MAG: transglycosylase SLT domain-containing protein, partial [Sphaerochaetaceae bacterium]|nr:transglycosylase SLT domain-containing protein [Sphaerochaetaceae bacterium]